VTRVFELKGRPSNVEISIHTNLNNDWAYFHFALINDQTGQAFDVGREVSHYSDEGSPNDSVIIPSVPAGRYYLRVEPEMSPTSLAARFQNKAMSYELSLRQGVPSQVFFWIAGLLLLVPPVFLSLRAASFEKSRWQESGTLAAASAGDQGDDDS
jgi:hypothetical protein